MPGPRSLAHRLQPQPHSSPSAWRCTSLWLQPPCTPLPRFSLGPLLSGHGRLWPNLLWPIRLWPILVFQSVTDFGQTDFGQFSVLVFWPNFVVDGGCCCCCFVVCVSCCVVGLLCCCVVVVLCLLSFCVCCRCCCCCVVLSYCGCGFGLRWTAFRRTVLRGTVLRRTALSRTAQNFALFLPFPAPPFRSFCVSLGVFSLNSGGV